MKRQKKPNAELVRDLVAANHILFNEGVVDGFGHVSARDDRDPGRFLLSRSIAPGTVTARDIMEFDLEGEPVEARGRRPYLERYIHSEIYRVRPDVQAVVHSHSPSVVPYGVTGRQLRPIFHMSGFLGQETPIFEIRDAGGPATDMLIRDRRLGAALARSLGQATFALMRGHGSVAVGVSIKQVVYRAIYAEVNARLQSDASRLGEITFLNEQEAARAMATNDGILDRPWELWKGRAKK
ncbi:MAG TPA: class II aldolase/adducin family protein [Burkholderiales bacterium]|jgi:HCOMODA/2-hydroxy-3-carboxy-muconic semialdehyde decarboxylase|nr:class II aldolase/adducin family protein [Burkholderiales bacterium]